jgi:hypothetical protein
LKLVERKIKEIKYPKRKQYKKEKINEEVRINKQDKIKWWR